MKLKLNINRVAAVVVLLFVAGCALIVVLDWREARSILGAAHWLPMLAALLFTAVSYSCLSASAAMVFRAFQIRLELRELLEIAFVSNVVTYLMNVGGVTGASLQFVLLKRRGQATEDILSASLFQLYLEGLILMALLPSSLFYLLGSGATSGWAVGLAASLLTVLLVAASLVIFVGGVRSVFLRIVARAGRVLFHRSFESALGNFDRALTRGVTFLRLHPGRLAILLVLAVVDWAATAAALWFCFRSFGQTVGVGELLTGFSLGVTAGFISFIPGGLGVQEGSMAGIYGLLGIPIETAVLSAILFRIVYYFVPFFSSLPFYRRLLRLPALPGSGQ